VQRLIPASGAPSPFVLGRQRDAGTSNPHLTAFLRTNNRWPVPTWFGGMAWQGNLGWKPPRTNLAYRTGNDFPFGAIRPGMDRYPRNVQFTQLNWNSEVRCWDSSPSAPANIALATTGARASVNEMENDFYQPVRLINGDYSDAWSSKRGGDHARWFAVDFGAVKRFDRISVLFGEQSRSNIDRIEVSQDGTSWKRLDVQYKTPDDINLPQPISARALRIVMGRGEHVLVQELEVFAPAPGQ
jgi:hypothetical protein